MFNMIYFFILSKKASSKHILVLALLLVSQVAKAEEDYVEKSFNPMYSYIIVAALFVTAIVIYSIFKRIDDKKKKKQAAYRAQMKQQNAGRR